MQLQNLANYFNRGFYVTCRTDKTLQNEEYHTAEDEECLSEGTVSPVNEPHTVRPVDYDVPPTETHAKVESEHILPPPSSSLN